MRRIRLEIESGLGVEVSDAGKWVIKLGDNEFLLEEIDDYFRAWLLLERPFSEVKSTLERIATDAKAEAPFSFAKLVGSAFKAQSGEWTDRAMTWESFLTLAERASLKSLLIEMRDSKWACQKTRQLARKHVNEIERRDGVHSVK